MVQDNKPNMRKETLSQVAASVPTRPRNYRVEYQRQQQRANLGCGFAVVVALGLVSVGIYGAYEAVNPTKDVTATVTDKVVKNDGNSSTYLIFTDKGVFENSDSLVNGKWDSSDVYSQIKKGHTYVFHVRGIRNHVLSWYPNILNVKDVKDLNK
jgi:hypothetical protein